MCAVDGRAGSDVQFHGFFEAAGVTKRVRRGGEVRAQFGRLAHERPRPATRLVALEPEGGIARADARPLARLRPLAGLERRDGRLEDAQLLGAERVDAAQVLRPHRVQLALEVHLGLVGQLDVGIRVVRPQVAH